MSGLSVTRIRDGLWWWSCPHPEWNGATDWDEVVGSVYCEMPDATVVIDPQVPAGAEDAERFWRAFDRDVERRGQEVVVLLTCRWHVRSASAFRTRYGARVVAPATTGHALHDEVVELVGDGAQPVAGIVSVRTGSPAPNEECVYVLTPYNAAVVGDILIGDHEGGLRIADAGWYANSDEECAWFRDGVPGSLERVLHFRIDHVFLGHGAPVQPDPAGQLRAVIDRHRAGG